MREKSLSTLGFIMNSLDVPTVSMAQFIHVDASLISKWKSGNRTLTGKSIYFDDIIHYLLMISQKSSHQILRSALTDLYPHNDLTDDSSLEPLLRLALSNPKSHKATKEHQLLTDGTNSVNSLVFEDNSGRRQAISKLLDYAEAMTLPGELVFIDSEEYHWMIEDTVFSKQFISRIEALLKRGFHAKFVIHYSSYRSRFFRLFNVYSSLIFDHNVEWYYYEYYDENIISFSFFLLNRAVSLLGYSAENTKSTTMVFTDSSLVIQHEILTTHIIDQCKNLFTRFNPSDFEGVVNDIFILSKKKSAFYTYLPAPAFMFARENLLREILEYNDLDNESVQKYLEISKKHREITSGYFSHHKGQPEPFVHIYQLEEMTRRAKTRPFVSGSLSIIGGKSMKITQQQYAQELRDLADGLLKYDNLQIVLVSEKDSVTLPSINCWCKKNIWMVQMDEQGFRLSEEVSIVNAASMTLERCIKKVPPERKEKSSVRKFLLELASELEK